jgi:hypothetical protein
MAEFEELRLTVSLVDNASAGLANIRAQLTGIQQTAGQVGETMARATAQVQAFGKAHQEAAPHLRNTQDQFKQLTHSAEEFGRGLAQTVLTMRGGVGALPQLALGLREASQGFSALKVSVGALAPEMAGTVAALGAVTLGVVAVGAAVAAVAVSAFNFSREMYQMSQSAKALGMTLGELKNLTDEGARFGVSAEQVVRSMAAIQQAQLNLVQRGSPLRQQLLGQGLDPNWLNEYTRQTDERVKQRMAVEKGTQIMREREAQGWGHMEARGAANQLAGQLGFDAGIYDRRLPPPMTEEQKRFWKQVDETSAKVNEIWGDILAKIREISEQLYLPTLKAVVLPTLEGIKAVVDLIAWGFEQIDKLIQSIAIHTPDWLKSFAGAAYGAVTGAARGAVTGGVAGAVVGGVKGALAPSSTAAETSSTAPGPAGNVPNGSHVGPGTGAGAGESAPHSGGGAGGIVAPAGTPIQHGGMAAVKTSTGKTFQVDARYAQNWQGFINDYEKAGGVIGPNSGTLGTRGNPSGHPIGEAMDINQTGRNIRGGGASLPIATENQLAEKWGLVSGANFSRPDAGHFGVRSPEAARQALIKQGIALPPNGQTAGPGTGAGAGESTNVRGSWFGNAGGGWRDASEPVDSPKSSVPGIALPNAKTKGQMFEVTTPDGRKFMLPQTDVGPAARTGRGIDITAAAAAQMGYKPGTFPTDGNFSYRRAGDDSGGGHPAGRPSIQDAVNAGPNKPQGIIDFESASFSPDDDRLSGGRAFSDFRRSSNIEDRRHEARAGVWRGILGGKLGMDRRPGPTPSSTEPNQMSADLGMLDILHASPGNESPFHAFNRQRDLSAWSSFDRAALDRGTVDRANGGSINSTGKLDVNVSAPAGTKVDYNGTNLLRNTSMQRQTQMLPTMGGPSVSDTADSYLRGGAF